MRINIEVTTMEDLFNLLKLEEHALYKVLVKHRADNPTHPAFLFTGYKNGNYCEVYNNCYESPVELSSIYSIKILKKLAKVK